MKVNLLKYGQYKYDLLTKLNFPFIARKKIIDVGCGDGSDAEIFINEYKLKTYGVDVYEHENIKKIKRLKFKKAGICKIPYKNWCFDYVFLHDVLHHIDEQKQNYKKHLETLIEIKRVCKKKGSIIIVEGNRYNPLFYPHMVKMLGHNHFKQSYFKKIIKEVFPLATFKYFEAHLYPQKFIRIWKIYEKIMELIIPKRFLAYNVAIINLK